MICIKKLELQIILFIIHECLNVDVLGQILFDVKVDAGRYGVNALEVEQALELGLVQTRVRAVRLLQVVEILERLQIVLHKIETDGAHAASTAAARILGTDGEEDGHEAIEIGRLGLERGGALILLVLLHLLGGEARLARVLHHRVVVEELLVVLDRIMSGYVGAYQQELHQLRQMADERRGRMRSRRVVVAVDARRRRRRLAEEIHGGEVACQLVSAGATICWRRSHVHTRLTQVDLRERLLEERLDLGVHGHHALVGVLAHLVGALPLRRCGVGQQQVVVDLYEILDLVEVLAYGEEDVEDDARVELDVVLAAAAAVGLCVLAALAAAHVLSGDEVTCRLAQNDVHLICQSE